MFQLAQLAQPWYITCSACATRFAQHAQHVQHDVLGMHSTHSIHCSENITICFDVMIDVAKVFHLFLVCVEDYIS